MSDPFEGFEKGPELPEEYFQCRGEIFEGLAIFMTTELTSPPAIISIPAMIAAGIGMLHGGYKAYQIGKPYFKP